MKKLYILLIFSAFQFCAIAQQRAVGTVLTLPSNTTYLQKVMTPTDTLFGWLVNGGTPSVYTSQNGGYLAGVNGYGDFAKMQQFIVTTPYMVEGCVYWFAGKGAGSSVGDPNSKITCNIYNMDGTGDNSTGTVTAPGTVASTVDVLWDDIDTSAAGAGGFVFVTFPAPFSATSDYACGVDFTTLAATDTTGLVSNASGEAGATELSWETWNDNTLHTIYSAWGTAPNNVDIDFGIFPIVDMTVGVDEMTFINGIKLYQNQPNPFKGESVVNYELDQYANDVKIFVHDMHGKMVRTFEQGTQQSGKYSINLNSNDFSDGVYYFSIQADNHRLARKMTVLK